MDLCRGVAMFPAALNKYSKHLLTREPTINGSINIEGDDRGPINIKGGDREPINIEGTTKGLLIHFHPLRDVDSYYQVYDSCDSFLCFTTKLRLM